MQQKQDKDCSCGHQHGFSLRELHEHPICVATIVYNVLVVAAELIILAFINDMSFHDLLTYEGRTQLIHVGGMIVLAYFNWLWVHKVTTGKESSTTLIGKFFSISTVMLVAHIVLLHLVPRWIGIELHHHDEIEDHAHAHSETVEYIALAVIVVFVTIAFSFRETILKKLNLKNKYQIKRK